MNVVVVQRQVRVRSVEATTNAWVNEVTVIAGDNMDHEVTFPWHTGSHTNFKPHPQVGEELTLTISREE